MATVLFLLLFAVVHHTSASDITCTYFKGTLRLTTTSRGKVFHLCRVNGINYELPNLFIEDIDALGFESGTTTLKLHNVLPNKRTQTLDVITGTPWMEIVPEMTQRMSISRTTGQREILVVRVVSVTGEERLEPSPSKKHLRNNIFGDPTNPSRLNFNLQYGRCSDGQLSFKPATHNGNSYGVVNLMVPEDLKSRDFTIDLESAVTRAFVAKFGAASEYDHIMYCLPKGMNGEFIAYATLNDNTSYFSDPWCESLSATMHEIAHNLGMAHSGELGEEEYDDESCILGIGYEFETAPQKCFNGQKFWAFNWFPNQRMLVNPIADGEWTGNLAAFVDVGHTTMPIVLRVGDLYLVYNRAKKHNYQVNEKPNMVTIVKAASPKSLSSMRAGIDASSGTDSYSCDATFEQGTFGVTIEVCKMVFDVGSSNIDHAELSIRRKGTPSSCGISKTPPAPTPPTFFEGGSTIGRSCKEDSDCIRTTSICVQGSTGGLCRSATIRSPSRRPTRRHAVRRPTRHPANR